MALHPIEEATLRAFVLRPARERLLVLFRIRKRRTQALDALNHFSQWDSRYAEAFASVSDLESLLQRAGPMDSCHVMSGNDELDGRKMPLADAIDACESHSFASLICCIPGELAIFFDEVAVPRRRLLLRRPANPSSSKM
jgi:hypothetical protein